GVASSTSITGMSSRTAYRSLQAGQSSADSRSRYSSAPLQRGQTRISRRRGASVMAVYSILDSLDAVAESSQRGGVAAPVGEHFHVEIEIDGRSDERLDLAARPRADGLDARSAGADENAFLTVALNVQHRSNVHRGTRLAKFLYFARDAVRDFILELLERRLADHLCREKAHVLRAEIFGVVVERMFGEERSHAVEEAGYSVTG